MSNEERRALAALLRDTDTWGENCRPNSWLADTSGLSEKENRAALKSLVSRGYAEMLKGLTDDEGKLCGSGYHITSEGRDAILADILPAQEVPKPWVIDEFIRMLKSNA